MLESCGLFYEQYAQKIKMVDEPDIMEDFKMAAKEGRIGGKASSRWKFKIYRTCCFFSELKCLIANLTSVDSYGQR